MSMGENDGPQSPLLFEVQRPGQSADIKCEHVVDYVGLKPCLTAFHVVDAQNPKVHRLLPTGRMSLPRRRRARRNDKSTNSWENPS